MRNLNISLFLSLATTSLLFAELQGPYDNERSAWGGNGGWWGDSQGNWYGERDVPTVPENAHQSVIPHAHRPLYPQGVVNDRPLEEYPQGGYHPNAYYYSNQYPYGGEIEPNDPALVDGAALYLPLKR